MSTISRAFASGVMGHLDRFVGLLEDVGLTTIELALHAADYPIANLSAHGAFERFDLNVADDLLEGGR